MERSESSYRYPWRLFFGPDIRWTARLRDEIQWDRVEELVRSTGGDWASGDGVIAADVALGQVRSGAVVTVYVVGRELTVNATPGLHAALTTSGRRAAAEREGATLCAALEQVCCADQAPAGSQRTEPAEPLPAAPAPADGEVVGGVDGGGPRIAVAVCPPTTDPTLVEATS